jgi:hypothetical protein
MEKSIMEMTKKMSMFVRTIQLENQRMKMENGMEVVPLWFNLLIIVMRCFWMVTERIVVRIDVSGELVKVLVVRKG